MICTGFFIYLYGTDTAENVCQITVVLLFLQRQDRLRHQNIVKPTFSLSEMLRHHYAEKQNGVSPYGTCIAN